MAVKFLMNTKRMLLSFQKKFNDVTTDPTFVEDIAIFTVDRIKTFTRQGKSIVTGSKFDPLKKSTIENRKRYEDNNQTSEFYRRRKSNLTFTGQLVNSLTAKKVRRGLFQGGVNIQIKPSGTHKGINYKNGGKAADIPNETLGRWTARGSTNRPARPFIGLDQKGIDTIKKKTIRQIRRSFGRR